MEADSATTAGSARASSPGGQFRMITRSRRRAYEVLLVYDIRCGGLKALIEERSSGLLAPCAGGDEAVAVLDAPDALARVGLLGRSVEEFASVPCLLEASLRAHKALRVAPKTLTSLEARCVAQWRALLADAVDRLAHRLERDLGPPRRGLSPVAALERGPYGLLAGATEATEPARINDCEWSAECERCGERFDARGPARRSVRYVIGGVQFQIALCERCA